MLNAWTQILRQQDATSPALLAILPCTRDALVIGPQAILILPRHGAAVALAQVAVRVVADRTLLKPAWTKAQAAQRIVQIATTPDAIARVLGMQPRAPPIARPAAHGRLFLAFA